MSFENPAAQGAEKNQLTDSLRTTMKDLFNNEAFHERYMTTQEKVDLLSKKVDADKEPLDKEGQDLRRRIDTDIILGNFEDISKIIASTKTEKLDKVLQKVIKDLSGEAEIRSYPSIGKDENGQTSLNIRFGTPPYACYFGEHAISITAKGVEFVYGSRIPEPGFIPPSLK